MLNEKSVGNLNSEYLAARDGERKAEDEAREALVKARKAESIAQTRDEESEQLQSTCDRLRNHRNEVQEELDELTERSMTNLLHCQSSVTLPRPMQGLEEWVS